MPFLVANFHNWDSDGEMILQLLVFLHGFTTRFFLTPFEAVRFAVIRFKPCSWDDGSDPLRWVHNHVLLACLGGESGELIGGSICQLPKQKEGERLPHGWVIQFSWFDKEKLEALPCRTSDSSQSCKANLQVQNRCVLARCDTQEHTGN